MGRDKALLPWGEGTLLDHALRRLRAVTPDVHVLAGAAGRYHDRGVPVHADVVPGQGPLAGLAAALHAGRPRPVLLLAVDLPLVPVPLLARLAEALAEADLVVPVWEAGTEPLCAAYGPACRPAVEAALRAGRRRMTSFWPGLAVRHLEGPELRAFGDPARLFLNVNDPETYAAARRAGA